MAQDSLRRLAGELKTFLSEQDEDEFITTAATSSAAAAVSVPAASKQTPRMAEGSTLTVDFPRAANPVPTPKTEDIAPVQDTPIMTTAQKQKALEEVADVIKIAPVAR